MGLERSEKVFGQASGLLVRVACGLAGTGTQQELRSFDIYVHY